MPGERFQLFLKHNSPTHTLTHLKFCVWASFLMLNKPTKKIFPESKILVFLGINSETHHRVLLNTRPFCITLTLHCTLHPNNTLTLNNTLSINNTFTLNFTLTLNYTLTLKFTLCLNNTLTLNDTVTLNFTLTLN